MKGKNDFIGLYRVITIAWERDKHGQSKKYNYYTGKFRICTQLIKKIYNRNVKGVIVIKRVNDKWKDVAKITKRVPTGDYITDLKETIRILTQLKDLILDIYPEWDVLQIEEDIYKTEEELKEFKNLGEKNEHKAI